MRGAVVFLALACVVLGLVPGLLFGVLAGLAPWASDAPTTAGLHLPGTGSLPTIGIAIVLVGLTGVVRPRCADAGAPHRRRAGRADRSSAASSNWTSAGFTKPLRLVLEPLLRPEREITVAVEGGVVQSVSYSGRVPHLIDERVYRPIARISLGGARHARRLQSGSIGTYAAYLIALVRRPARRRAARSDRMNAATWASGSRADRRRAPARAAPAGARPALEGAPAGTPRARARSSRTASCAGCGARAPSTSRGPRPSTASRRRSSPPASSSAVLLVPVGRLAPNWGLGHDMLALAGMLALARFAARRRVLGCRERLRADGREPRPDDLGLRRDRPRPGGHRAGADRRDDRPAGDGRRDRRGPAWSNPALALAAAAFAVVVDRRDRPPAGRQPRHPPRADDDPRGPAARVRGPRPRVPAVGGRGPALARARARGAGVPAPPERSVAGARDAAARARRSVRRPGARPSRSSPRCGSCSCRG